jgi:hypothetical protein
MRRCFLRSRKKTSSRIGPGDLARLDQARVHLAHAALVFPTDVTVDQVCDIAMGTGRSISSRAGKYGDQWDYVLAVHDDRAHKHAHIILNNRGVENGTWFSCWAEGVMSPQLMREKQAEIAEGYGVGDARRHHPARARHFREARRD